MPANPIVGTIAEMVKANLFDDEAIDLEIDKSKKEPKTMPTTATASADNNGIRILFIITTSQKIVA